MRFLLMSMFDWNIDNLIKSTAEAIRHLKASQQKCNKKAECGRLEVAKSSDNETEDIKFKSFFDNDMHTLYQERLSGYYELVRLFSEKQEHNEKMSSISYFKATNQQADFMGDLTKIAEDLVKSLLDKKSDCEVGYRHSSPERENISFDCDKEVSLPFENVLQRVWSEGCHAISSEDHNHTFAELLNYKHFIRPVEKELALVESESEEDERNGDGTTLEDSGKTNMKKFETQETDKLCPMKMHLTSSKRVPTVELIKDNFNKSYSVLFHEENHPSQNNSIQYVTRAGEDETLQVSDKQMFVNTGHANVLHRISSSSFQDNNERTWIYDDESESIEELSDNCSGFTIVDHWDHTHFSEADQLDPITSVTKKKSAAVVSLEMNHEAADKFLKARKKQVTEGKNKYRLVPDVEHLLIPGLKDARKETVDFTDEESIKTHASDHKTMFRNSLCRGSVDLVEYRKLLLKDPSKIPRSLNFASLFGCTGDDDMNGDCTTDVKDAMPNQVYADVFNSYAPSMQVLESIPEPMASSIVASSLSCSTGATDVQTSLHMGKEFVEMTQKFSKDLRGGAVYVDLDMFDSYAPSIRTGIIDVLASLDMGRESVEMSQQFPMNRNCKILEARKDNSEIFHSCEVLEEVNKKSTCDDVCHSQTFYNRECESYEDVISELSWKQKKEIGKSLDQEVAEGHFKPKVCKLEKFISDILHTELQVQEQGAHVHKFALLLSATLATEATSLHQLGQKLHLTFGFLVNLCLEGNHAILENGKDSSKTMLLRHCLLDVLNFAHQHNIGSHKVWIYKVVSYFLVLDLCHKLVKNIHKCLDLQFFPTCFISSWRAYYTPFIGYKDINIVTIKIEIVN
ncbi:hypothetical protein O6H91_10G077600 [Diphasiastrum complanatum]|uniref:Uncharacterized protein n=1 Tax=Diphasiastrum complanatum TaxID=34168 RepID=A0ACC2CIN2_DIPCM|nr:hypothetical protein O6H91_10G077600 [Diphasiastrum complanatum]